MPILREAWAALKRNQPPVFAYVLISMAVIALASGLDVALQALVEEGEEPVWWRLYNVARQVGLSAAVAALQACVFASLGIELDKPLWKCEGCRSALRRFFLPWFIINLSAYAVLAGEIWAAGAEMGGLVLTGELIFMLYFAFAVPVGACVMFWGRLQWTELGEALQPLATQFRYALIPALLGLLGYFVHVAYSEFAFQGYVRPVLGPALAVIPLTMIELLQFAATWEICRIYRNTDQSTDTDIF